MNANWPEIVELLKSAAMPNMYCPLVESCMRILGWKKTNGSMITTAETSGRHIDIILKYPDDQGNMSSVIAVFVPSDAQTLISESDINNSIASLGIQYALQFCKGLHVYNKDKDALKEVFVIPFEKDDLNGHELCNHLEAERFNLASYHDYMVSLCESSSPYTQMCNYLRNIQSETIKELLKEKLHEFGLAEDVVEEELDKYKISFKPKTVFSSSPKDKNENGDKSKNHFDTTRFSFDGVNYYNKRVFVLKVVAKYIEEHPKVTLQELEKQFPSKIISKRRGVVRSLDLVNSWIRENPDIKKRYSLAPNEVLVLSDGTKVVVNNQWGKRFPYFLQIAKSLYQVTSNRPYEYEIQEEDNNTGEDKKITISIESLQSFVKKK